MWLRWTACRKTPQSELKPLPSRRQEYGFCLILSFEVISDSPGRHTLGVQFRPDMGVPVTVKELPEGAVSWNYDAASGWLTLQTDVAEKPDMPAHVS